MIMCGVNVFIPLQITQERFTSTFNTYRRDNVWSQRCLECDVAWGVSRPALCGRVVSLKIPANTDIVLCNTAYRLRTARP